MVLLSIHFNKLPSSNQSDLASTALAGAARPHLKKLGDQASGSKSDFKCCTHCNGQVQVVWTKEGSHHGRKWRFCKFGTTDLNFIYLYELVKVAD